MLREVIRSNGRTAMYCCPDLPPSRAGIAHALPRYRPELGWEGRRWNQTATEHLQRPCPACTAAGWGRPLDET
ncbi:hypothetical protein [Streptomyces coeruleorubidus]|uniref:hypothetical protein n=1 Tax=Streptomyces coeruleorubidus TaxID=116188 RepID=UPI0033DDA777